MKKASPAPINTPISDDTKQLQLPWKNWLREISNYMLESTIEKPFGTQGLNYINIGKQCNLIFNGTLANTRLMLPYIASSSRYLTYYINGERKEALITKGNNYVELPTQGTLIISDYFFAELA